MPNIPSVLWVMGRDEALLKALLSWLWDSIKRPGGVPDDRKKLRKHIFSTYWWLRLGMVFIAGLFPWVLVIVGRYYNVEWYDSMSAYYWAPSERGELVGEAPMRVWFVGPLFALGTCLFLYKGYTWLEDMLLNAAAVCAICVALIPMCWGTECPIPMCWGLGCPVGSWSSLHYWVAFGFFGFVALVAILHMCYALGLLWRRPNQGSEDPPSSIKYAIWYIFWALVMLIAPLSTLIVFNPFWGEVVGIGAFCGFWIVQIVQIRNSKIDQELAS